MDIVNVNISGGMIIRSDIIPAWIYNDEFVPINGIVGATVGKIVAVGEDGLILSSDDSGTTWTASLKGAVAPTRIDNTTISYFGLGGSTNQTLVATFSGGVNTTSVYSTDQGSTWTNMAANTGFGKVVWTGTNWVGQFTSGGNIFAGYTTDFQTWTVSSVPNRLPRVIPGIEASDGNGSVIASDYNSGNLYKSSDYGVSYAQFFITSNDQRQGPILYSDGFFFLSRTDNSTRQYYYAEPNYSGFNYVNSITMPAGTYFRSIAGNGTIYVAVFQNGTIGTLNKSDVGGVTPWTIRSTGSTQTFRTVTFTNSKFFIGGTGGIIMSSIDGITWTTVRNTPQLNTLGTMTTAVQSGNNLILFGYSSPSARVFVSTNKGISFNAGVLPVSTYPYDSMGDGTNYFVILENYQILRSTNGGLDWTTVRNAPGDTGLPPAMCFGSTSTTYKYIATTSPSYTNTNILASTNGTSWVNIASVSFWIKRIRFYNSTFIAVGERIASGSISICVATSTNGSSWNSILSVISNVNGNDIAFNGTIYVIAGSGGRVYTSTNLTGWTTRQVGSTSFISIIFDGSKFILTGQSGSIFTSTDAITWTNISCDQAMAQVNTSFKLGPLSNEFISVNNGLLKYNT